jgi:GWxTD domain-containing protein
VAFTSCIKMTACFLVAAVVAMCIGSPARAQSSRGNLPNEYQRWLDEDVRWIITPEERAAFIQLKDEDRDRFVETFWRHRNPTQGTAKNEFKEEHYRRLAYANEHFAYVVPGWNTDRGRIYIVYGPPEEIKTDSGRIIGDPAKPPQVWHYHSLMKYGKEIDLKFVDGCSCGDHRLDGPQKNLLIRDN